MSLERRYNSDGQSADGGINLYGTTTCAMLRVLKFHKIHFFVEFKKKIVFETIVGNTIIKTYQSTATFYRNVSYVIICINIFIKSFKVYINHTYIY